VAESSKEKHPAYGGQNVRWAKCPVTKLSVKAGAEVQVPRLPDLLVSPSET